MTRRRAVHRAGRWGLRDDERAACGRPGRRLRLTHDPAEVTCPLCIRDVERSEEWHARRLAGVDGAGKT